jgi:hypothetical protein
MAEKKISELPIIETPSASALIPIVVDGNGVANTNAISASALGGYIAGIVTGRTNTFTNTNTYLGTQIFNANIQTNSEIENVSTGIRVFNSLQSINNYTGSDSGVINRILQTTASLNTQTGSQNSVNLGISTFSGSIRSEVSGIEAYTASLKAVAIVSSSQQISNYNIFATTGSNIFVGNQTITGSLIVSGSNTFTNIGRTELTGSVEINGDVGVYGNITSVQKTIEVLGFPTNQPAFYSEGDILLSGSLSIHVEELGESFDVAEQFQQAFSSISFTQEELEIISSSFATTGSNTFIGNQNINGSVTSSKVLTDSVRFNTSAGVSVGVGELAWNNSDGTLDLGMKGGVVVQQIGQEIFYEVRNDTGIQIPNGTAVFANGVTAGSGRITVAPYTADGSVREVRFLGIATENISTGVNGFVTHFGYVRGLDTRGTTASSIAVGDEDWSVGDVLYVHPTVAGKLTNVPPKHEISAAIVITRHQSVGVLFVRPTSYGHLDDIHDVQITTASLSTGQMLVYNSGTDYWENTNSLSGSYQLTGSLDITGSVNIDKILKLDSNWTGEMPAGEAGQIIASSSYGFTNLYVHDGSEWKWLVTGSIPQAI